MKSNITLWIYESEVWKMFMVFVCFEYVLRVWSFGSSQCTSLSKQCHGIFQNIMAAVLFKSCVFFTFISWMSCIFVLIPSMSVDAFYQSCHLKRLLYGLQLLQPNSVQAKGLEDGGIYQLVGHFLELLLSRWLNKLNAGYLCRLSSPAWQEKDYLSINGYGIVKNSILYLFVLSQLAGTKFKWLERHNGRINGSIVS